MIIYDKEKKELIIPNSLGNFNGYEQGREDQRKEDEDALTSITIGRNGQYVPDYGFKTVDVDINEPHLHIFSTDDVDYEDVREYFEGQSEVVAGACSALYRDGKVIRSFDWYYNHQVPFLVFTPNGVKGISCGLSGATVETMEEGLDDEIKTLIPWYLADGINDDGLCIEVNVVPADSTESHPEEQTDRICSTAIVRYVLDHYSTVDEAIEGLSHIQIYFPKALLDMNYNVHWMIADKDKSVVVEVVDGQMVAIECDKSTNFHIEGVETEDGFVYTNADAADGYLPSYMGIEAYGAGLERWNILNGIEDETDEEVLDLIKYSQSYTKDMDINFWYSEFVGSGITTDTPYTDEAFIERIEQYKAKWDDRTRDENTVWISTHQCIYDLVSGEMKVRTQEHNATDIIR